MTTLQDDLDAAIPAAPVLPSVEDTLGAGRTALRRRRQGAAAGLVAAAAVVAVVAVTGLAGAGTDGARPVAPADQTTDALPTPAVSETPWTVPPEQYLRNQDPVFKGSDEQAQYDYDGMLLIRPGAEVLHRWENPMDLPAPGTSIAMILENHDTTYWTLAVFDGGISDDWDGGGTMSTISVEPSEANGLPFERWVQDQMAVTGLGWPDPDYVTLGPDGHLAPAGEATILAQTSTVPPRVVPKQADAATVGLVQTGEAHLCVYAAQAPGHEPQYLYLPASIWGPDLAGCIATMPGWNLRP